MNYSQFCDLFVGERLLGAQMTYLVFRPNGQIENAETITFPIHHRVKGVPYVRILGTTMSMNIDHVNLRPGDTVTISPGMLTINTEGSV